MVKPVPARQPLIRHRDRLASSTSAVVRSWLTPATALARWRQAWPKARPPTELRRLLDSLSAGHGLYLYLPPLIQRITVRQALSMVVHASGCASLLLYVLLYGVDL
jgi:hypothetical protein